MVLELILLNFSLNFQRLYHITLQENEKTTISPSHSNKASITLVPKEYVKKIISLYFNSLKYASDS